MVGVTSLREKARTLLLSSTLPKGTPLGGLSLSLVLIYGKIARGD